LLQQQELPKTIDFLLQAHKVIFPLLPLSGLVLLSATRYELFCLKIASSELEIRRQQDAAQQ
jgi:hypothetical protein